MEAQNIKASNLSHVVIGGGAESVIEHLNQHPDVIRVQATQEHCLEQGYAPRGYGLADFSIIRWQGRFHLFHIPRVPGNAAIHRGNEHWIGHAVSDDLNTWVACNPAICIEPLNYFESAHVWAPFVHVEGEDARAGIAAKLHCQRREQHRLAHAGRAGHKERRRRRAAGRAALGRRRDAGDRRLVTRRADLRPQ